jgi:hypothetical protein
MAIGNDPKLRGASRAAKNVLKEFGNPQDLGVPYTDRQIFETTNELMPASIEYAGGLSRPDAFEGQWRNMHGPAYGDDGHANSMDDVDRSQNPEITQLEAQFMGQGDTFAPPSAAGTSTLMGRTPRRPSGTKSGDKTIVGNRY